MIAYEFAEMGREFERQWEGLVPEASQNVLQEVIAGRIVDEKMKTVIRTGVSNCIFFFDDPFLFRNALLHFGEQLRSRSFGSKPGSQAFHVLTHLVKLKCHLACEFLDTYPFMRSVDHNSFLLQPAN